MKSSLNIYAAAGAHLGAKRDAELLRAVEHAVKRVEETLLRAAGLGKHGDHSVDVALHQQLGLHSLRVLQ